MKLEILKMVWIIAVVYGGLELLVWIADKKKR